MLPVELKLSDSACAHRIDCQVGEFLLQAGGQCRDFLRRNGFRVRVVADPAFDVSIDVGVVFPVNGDWALFGATVVRARLTERFTMDSGLEVALRFGRVDNDPHLDLFVPFSALVQLHPSVFVAARTGVRWVDFDDLAFPLGFELGYTIANAERPLMDLTLGFGFPALLTPNADDKAQEDVWQVTLAGYAYFAL